MQKLEIKIFIGDIRQSSDIDSLPPVDWVIDAAANPITKWCQEYIGDNDVTSTDINRPFDIPWIVLESSLASHVWDWQPQASISIVLSEISEFSKIQTQWCSISLS